LRKLKLSVFALPAKSLKKSENNFTRCGADHSGPAVRGRVLVSLRTGAMMQPGQTLKGRLNMKSTAFLSTVAVLALLAGGPAFAGPPNAPTLNQTQHNSAPTTQDSTSTAKAKHGDASALGLNNNAIEQQNLKFGKGGVQTNDAPTTQDATSDAFARRGNADATSVNTNEIIQENDKLGRKGAHQTNSAPTTQSATSHAVSIGGDADALSANSNGVSQSNGAAK
jgi:hypothetical protein